MFSDRVLLRHIRLSSSHPVSLKSVCPKRHWPSPRFSKAVSPADSIDPQSFVEASEGNVADTPLSPLSVPLVSDAVGKVVVTTPSTKLGKMGKFTADCSMAARPSAVPGNLMQPGCTLGRTVAFR